MEKQNINAEEALIQAEQIFLDNVVGYAVIIMKYFFEQDNKKFAIEEATTHLHFLYSYYKNHNILDVVCLDTSDAVSINNYEIKDTEYNRYNTLRRAALREITNNYLSRVLESNKDNELYNKAKGCYVNSKLWDKFREIRDECVSWGIKKFTGTQPVALQYIRDIDEIRNHEIISETIYKTVSDINNMSAGYEVEVDIIKPLERIAAK